MIGSPGAREHRQHAGDNITIWPGAQECVQPGFLYSFYNLFQSFQKLLHSLGCVLK